MQQASRVLFSENPNHQLVAEAVSRLRRYRRKRMNERLLEPGRTVSGRLMTQSRSSSRCPTT